MDDAVKTSHMNIVQLVQISETEFFINGHQNDGMQDLIITISNKGLILKDGSINFKAEIIKH